MISAAHHAMAISVIYVTGLLTGMVIGANLRNIVTMLRSLRKEK